MSLFESVITQVRTGDLAGAANTLIAITQGTISYEEAMREVKDVAAIFKKPRIRRRNERSRRKTQTTSRPAV